jgi:Leucine-rich repeat (LRR) protein
MNKVLLLLIFALGLFSQTRQTDSLALVAIYNAFDGSNWSNNTNWLLSGQSIDTWSGVSITSDRVSQLSLNSRNLNGKFPTEIGDLTALTYLNLSNNNNINDSIPSEIGKLTELVTLYLYNCALNGELPEKLYELDKLQTLYLYSNSLEGSISSSIDKMKELRILRLYNNRFTSLPNEIGRLTKLNDIRISSNQLTSLPDSIAQLSSLVTLEASNNLISSLPLLGGLSSLSSLTMDNNFLTDLTGKLTGLNITSLFLSGNKGLSLSGIADEVKTLTNLATLNASNCTFNEGLPADLFDTANLINLYLTNSKITGQIPAAVQNAPLNQLVLENNEINGSIPLELTRLKNLNYLNLNNNQFTGSIPDSIGQLENLGNLYLSGNSLTGSIPQTIGRLKKLSNFRVENNELSGTLTDSLINCIQLDYLYLTNNKVSGAFPAALLNHADLDYLYLENNLFSSLPDFTGTDLSNAQVRVRYNQLGFNSIVPNLTGVTGSFPYNPQSNIGTDSIISVIIGDTVTLSVFDNHVDNTYKWYKNGIEIIEELGENLQVAIDSSDDLASYTYQIRNSNTGTFAINSAKFNIISPDLIAPNVPSSLASSNQNSGASFSWAANTEPDFDKYYIYYGTSQNASVVIDSTDQNSIVLTGLTNEQTYYFRLKAKDVWGNLSDYSTEITASPDGIAPTMVQNLQSVAGETIVTLTWDQNPESDLQYYRVYRSANVNDTSYYTQTSSLSQTVYSLTNNLQYYFWVRAVDYAGNMGPYTPAVLETPMDFPPTKPVNFKAVANNTSAYLSWNTHNQGDVRAYYLYQSNSPNATTVIDSVIGRTNNLDTITGLVSETKYYFRMRALDNAGNFSDYSDESVVIAGKSLITDSLALVALYNATDGPSWSNANNWLNGNINTWEGVGVSSGRVTQLYLNSKGLNGVLPSEIGQLDALTSLGIRSNNNLTDTIPKSIGNLVNLTNLDFYNNSLSGSIPSEIGNLSNLTTLELRNNDLTGMPIEIGNLKNLVSLFLSSNKFSGILTTGIGGLINLSTLNIDNNQISGLPSQISLLASLTNLSLVNNNFTSLPSEIGSITSLNVLGLSQNKLSSLPSSISNLVNLTTLDITANLFTSLPNELNSLSNLTTLYLNNNIISTLPSDLSGLTSLSALYITSNQMTSLPSGIFTIPNLQTLNISTNRLTDLSSAIDNLSSLTTLSAGYNQFTKIPSAVYKLTNLLNLDLRNSQISVLSDSLFGLTKLTYLYLQSNQIDTILSGTISNMLELRYLNLDYNQFRGSIPASLGNMAKLAEVYLRNNNFSGALPDNIKNSSSIYNLYLTGNKLSSIPDFTGSNIDASLRYYDVRNNELTFSSLIPNVGVPQYQYYYNPQSKIGIALDTILTSGSALTLRAIAGHIDNNYQWYKGTTALVGQTADSLVLTNITSDSIGTFSYRVTNPNLSLTLTSKDQIIRVPDLVAPPTPANFVVAPRNESVIITWSAVNALDLKHYKIFLGTSAASLALVDSVTSSNSTISGLTNGTEYFFQVSAIDLFGNESGRTAILSTVPDGTAPAAPDSLVATGEDNRIRLTWNAPADTDILVYRIYRGLTENPTSFYSNTSNLIYYDNGPSNGQTFHYRVTALDIAQNEGSFSNNAFGTAANLPPSAPNNFTAVGGDQKAYLNWDNNPESDVAGYFVYQASSANATTLVDSVFGRTNSELVINGLTNGNNYFFRTRARDNEGVYSDYSDESQVLTGQFRVADSLALVAIYNATDGVNWSNASNWLDTNQTIDTWQGVSVTGERVTGLNLYNKQLNGALPTDLGNLTGLSSLTISQNNSLTGSIPSSLGNLTNLTNLNLYNNELSGDVPSTIGALTKLTNLDLRYNKLTGSLPAEIASLVQLEKLYIDANKFSGVLSSGIGGLTNLAYLYIGNNEFSELPTEIGNATNLIELYINNNLLTTLPSGVGNLINLTRLEAYNNKITSLPVSIGSMSSLNRLNLENNLLLNLPNEVNNLVSLQYLFLTNNRIVSLPADLSGTGLVSISLNGNQLSALPAGLFTATSLVELNISNNSLTDVSSGIQSLTNLKTLTAQSNLFTEIPSSIFGISSLETLNLSSSRLTSLGNGLYGMSGLKSLTLANNQISSTLSDSISNMTNLVHINIENNRFLRPITWVSW